MGNFKDFDLDLRNVASGGEAEPNGVSEISTKITIGVSKMSLKNKYKSVDTPTTGRSAMCCKRTNAAAEPQCI